MTTSSSTKVPTWFWVVSGLALVWNLLGLMAFFMQVTMSPEALAALPEAEQKLYAAMPFWVNIVFALAVFGGTLGCIGLLLRKSWAKMALIASVVGSSAQFFYSLVLSDAPEVYGMTRMIMPMVIIVIGVLLIWLANTAERKGWLT